MLKKIINSRSNFDLFPVLPSSYGLVLNELAKNSNKILFICNGDADLELITKQINFFNSELNIVTLPSWDCSNYEKISPNISNLNERINSLNSLSNFGSKNLILVTTINSLIQLLPPKDLFLTHAKIIKVGDLVEREELLLSLISLSFRRVEVASEPGDFAVRGSIIDIIAKENEGWRLDFFGNKLEKIRIFDPMTQISSNVIEEIRILPSSEVILNQETIESFCYNFQHSFGSAATEHPMYEAIKNGRKYPGMEHYLPLFYKELSSIFDYFVPDLILFDSNWEKEFYLKLQNIQEHYKIRKELLLNRFQDEVIYYPISPEKLWLDQESIINKLERYQQIKCHSFDIDSANGVDLKLKSIDNFDLISRSKKVSAFDLLKEYRDKAKKKIIIACNSEGSLQRIKSILENYNIHWYHLKNFSEYKNLSIKTIGVTILNLEAGYSYEDFAIISEQDLLGKKIARKSSSKDLDHLMAEINNLQIGEYIVHKNHGIGLFSGLEAIKAAGMNHDCLKIIYDNDDILYLPVENFDLLSRYGSSEDHVRLDKLGGHSWQSRKAKLKEKLKEIAAELVKTAALRASREGESLVAVSSIYEEFCAKFQYLETDDQLRSIRDVEQDLSSGRPMDRLICGDVGFGKTEVAMRAAFIATNAENNVKKQVAIVVPTTLLARQHYHSFFKRFSGFPIQVKQLSRLVSSGESKLVKQGLKDGTVDIIIGTHALFAKDIEFKNLGLLIIDEEQRFGVLQKEKLKKLQEQVHILTLSATPIPRTLQMSLTGIKDLSIIASPPIDRQVVKTYIMNYDSIIIREAIMRELYRGGQIFYVCPRISDLNELLPKLKELVPEIKIVIAHGQMSPVELEQIMSDFYNKKFHLLLSTTIIESGIDIAEANTIFIHRADKFGLSALYQLRGRVGRSNVKAFAYLLLPNKQLTKLSSTRLEVMQTLDTLGAGFTVASHDMDIRGFGNLVGDEQSGHVKEVGLELYQEMLQEAISTLKENKANQTQEEYSPQINLNLPVLLPESYITDLNLRLSIYRNLANLKTVAEVDSFAVELVDRFGVYPIEVDYLLATIKLKIQAKKINIDKIDAGPKAITLGFKDNNCLYPEQTMEFISKNQLVMKLRADHKILISKEFKQAKEKILYISQILDKLNFLS
ncbi:MAG: transcription-repair coupling factor [Rickettsiales bacterium]